MTTPAPKCPLSDGVSSPAAHYLDLPSRVQHGDLQLSRAYKVLQLTTQTRATMGALRCPCSTRTFWRPGGPLHRDLRSPALDPVFLPPRPAARDDGVQAALAARRLLETGNGTERVRPSPRACAARWLGANIAPQSRPRRRHRTSIAMPPRVQRESTAGTHAGAGGRAGMQAETPYVRDAGARCTAEDKWAPRRARGAHASHRIAARRTPGGVCEGTGVHGFRV